MPTTRFTAAFLLLFCAANAQNLSPVPALRHSDPESHKAREQARLALPSIRTPLRSVGEVRLEPLSTEAISTFKSSAGTDRSVAGLHRAVPQSFLENARLDQLADGRQVWRTAIRSQGAGGVRVHFTNFDVGAGRVWIHDGSGQENAVYGPYSGRGPLEDGDFWSDAVLSDSLVIEFEPASPLGPIDLPPFRVEELSHLLPEAMSRFDAPKENARAAAASCNLDVTCHPEWAETSKAVAHILYEAGGGAFVCSGTLLNTRNNSRIPYFLTAQHCIADDATARTVNAFWFYETGRCNGPAPDRRNARRTLGARYLAGTPVSSGDGTLLQLTSVPDGVNFSGWDPSPFGNDVQVTGIHHPSGDFKRISFGVSQPPTRFSGKDLTTFVGAFWNGGGLTEGGSSGSGLFSGQLQLVGMLSHGPKADSQEAYCALLPFADNYGRFSSFYPFIRDFLEDRTTTPPTTPPTMPPSAGGPLTSGQARAITIPAVTAARLLNGTAGFTIQVPAGATRLEINLRTSTPGVDVDLFARFGQDVTLDNGQVVSDFRSEGLAGDEQIVVTGSSLRTGTYFIALGVLTPGVEIRSTLTATVTTSSTPPPSTGGSALTSGQPRTVSFPAVPNPTLLRGDFSLTINVPQGATRLEVALRTTTPNADVDLYVRSGQDVVLQDGRVTTDFRSESDTGNENIVISGAQLQPGTYFIAFGVFTTNTAIQATVTATVTGGTTPPPTTPPPTTPPPASGPTALTSGQARNMTFTPVANPTLFRGEFSFTINVPQGATRLEVNLRTSTPNADVDLYVRRGQDVALENSRVVTDFRSEKENDGNESIVISGAQLQAGTYFIAFGVFSSNLTIQSSVTATVTSGSNPTQPGGALTSGQARTFSAGPVSSPTLLAEPVFTVTVPQNATRLEITLRTTTPNADVDLFARIGQQAVVENGRVVSDFRSQNDDGNESIVISGSALRAGTYFVSFAMFTSGVTAQCSITATVTTASAPPPASGPITLTSGTPANFRIGPVANPTLFAGERGFRIQVPQGATRLQIRVATNSPASADVDLYARFNQDVTISEGTPVTDHAAEGPTGTESITILPTSSPQLRAGTYFLALGLFTPNEEVTGSITATISTSASVPAPTAVTVLSSGVGAKFALPAVDQDTLFFGNRSFRIDVPQGATRLTVQLKSDVPAVDTDLYVRAGSDTEVDGEGFVVADFASNSRFADETIVIDALSSPPLRQGPYFISVGVFTKGVPTSGTITATIERATVSGTSGTVLRNGTPVLFRLPAVSQPTLFTGRDGFQISVPDTARRLDIVVKADPPSTDVDLFVRYASPPEITSTGALLTDYRSVTDTGEEQVLILPGSRPALRSGVYHIALGLFSPDVVANGSILASFSSAANPTEFTDSVTLRDKPGIFLHFESSKSGRLSIQPKLPGILKSSSQLEPKKRIRATEREF